MDSFLQARGYRPDSLQGTSAAPPSSSSPGAGRTAAPLPAAPVEDMDFVAEEDVRRAIARGVKIRLTGRAIVTPAARDLAAGRDVLVDSGT